MALQPLHPFPLGETLGPPFSPCCVGGAAPNRWPATTSGPASFLPSPKLPPLRQIYLRPALQSGRPNYLRAATYTEERDCMTRRGPLQPTDWLTNTALKAHACNPQEPRNTPIEGGLGTYMCLPPCITIVAFWVAFLAMCNVHEKILSCPGLHW